MMQELKSNALNNNKLRKTTTVHNHNYKLMLRMSHKIGISQSELLISCRL